MRNDTDFEIADLSENDDITIIDKPTGKKQQSQQPQKPQGFQINFHVVFLCAIVLIIGFAVIRLIIWNKGVQSDYDPDADTSEFDIEALDSIIPLDPSKLAGHEDDGITTILCLGNDAFAEARGEANSLSEQIAVKAEATVYNGAFPGTTIAAVNPSYSDDYQLDAFSFSYVARALASGNFDQLKWVAPYVYDDAFPATTELLESVDMDDVDIICVMYDGSDYTNGRVCDDPNVPNLITTYTGALRTGIQAIQGAYPHIRIVVMSHSFCHWINGEGNFENGDRTDLGNGTLSHYLQKELDTCNDCSVSFIDNFYGSVNEDNYLDYMRDNIHFNDAGRELLAQRFVDKILKK